MNPKLLPSLLQSIERNLVDWIPMGVKELEIDSPAYCLFVWYQDFSGDYTPHIGVGTQKLLEAIQSTEFTDPDDRLDMIWRPQQTADLDVPGRLFLDECDIVENEVENCYELLAKKVGLYDDLDEDEESNEDEDEDEDEDESDSEEEDEDEIDEDDNVVDEDDLADEIDKEFEALVPFREMMHRVGKKLAAQDWSKIMPVTDHFVVLVCDYMGYWLAEDFEKCVDQESFDRLVQCGMLRQMDEE